LLPHAPIDLMPLPTSEKMIGTSGDEDLFADSASFDAR
jgi:hypothetical protein